MEKIYAFFLLYFFISLSAFGTTYYVKHDAAGLHTGTSWGNAYTTLQAALDKADTGDQIWVAVGTYKSNKDRSEFIASLDFSNKTFHIKDGIKIYGGFVGTETMLSERDTTKSVTSLSGDSAGGDASIGMGDLFCTQILLEIIVVILLSYRYLILDSQNLMAQP